MRTVLFIALGYFLATAGEVQTPVTEGHPTSVYLLKPARVFDGESAALHEGWVVLVRGDRIDAAGPAVDGVQASTTQAASSRDTG